MPPPSKSVQRMPLLSKAERAALPPYQGISLGQIHRIETLHDAEDAWQHLQYAQALGFDTESRPRFRKDDDDHGINLVQLATVHDVYLLPLRFEASLWLATKVLGDASILKIGFDLANDKRSLARQHISLVSPFDLDSVFKQVGYRQNVGLQLAVALLFKQSFTKSKSITLSDWSAYPYSEAQECYAANDAYVALHIYQYIATWSKATLAAFLLESHPPAPTGDEPSASSNV